jgi:hypothetical protein
LRMKEEGSLTVKKTKESKRCSFLLSSTTLVRKPMRNIIETNRNTSLT